MGKDKPRTVDNIVLYLAGAAVSFMTFIVAANSISRYFFNRPFPQVEEIATSMFTWLIFLGSAVCYKEGMHIGIDCFVNMLPTPLRRGAQIVVDVILLAANMYLLYLSARLTISAWGKLTPSLRVPYSFIDASAVISFLIMGYHSVRFLVRDIAGFRLPEPAAEQEEPA